MKLLLRIILTIFSPILIPLGLVFTLLVFMRKAVPDMVIYLFTGRWND